MAEDKKYLLYHYNPSLAAAVVFIALFLCSTTVHMFQLFKKRTWYFIPFIIGGFFEWIGYIGRAITSKQSPNWTIPPYVLQSLLLLLAPALFAASIYMILGRIILLTDGEKHSIIRRRWLTKVFVAGDVLSFFVQSGGGGILAQAKTQSKQHLGETMITVGLIIQLIFFGFFILVSALFHCRISLAPTLKSQCVDVPWARYLWILYTASILIMIRSIFRVIEYVQGSDGVLLKTEAYLYVFDATLMFLTMVLFNLQHPSMVVTKDNLKDLTDNESTGEVQVGYLLPEQSPHSSSAPPHERNYARLKN